MEAKLTRKVIYLKSLAKYFKNEDLKLIVDQIQSEIQGSEKYIEPGLKMFFLKCKNNKLRSIKKKYENMLYNEFSNRTAFHLKKTLKNVPVISLYTELFKKVSEEEIKETFSRTKGNLKINV